MGVWYKKKILFSKHWQLINKDLVDPKYAFDIYAPDKKYYVLHYFMADCDKCVYELLQAREFIKKTEKEHSDLKYVFIATGPINKYIMEAISKAKFQFPVYFENNFMGFSYGNHFPPGDDTYNTMLLNGKNEVLLFGSYYGNKKAEALYSDIINCNK